MLPSYNYNAMLNFEPVTQALQQNRSNAMADEKLGMERERFGMERDRVAEAKQDAIRKRVGGLALLTLQEQDAAKRDAKWKQVMSLHPEAAKLPSHYADPSTGPLALLADAGMSDAYLNHQLRQQQAALAQAADGRAAALHGPQLQAATLDAAIKKREFDTPTEKFQGFSPGSLVIGQSGGNTRIVQPGTEQPPAEHIAKASNFAARMIEAERNVRHVLSGDDPIAPTGKPTKKFDATDVGILATSALPEAARNMVISNEHQRYRQAAEQWIRAFLRKESGAAIGQDEFARDFVVYFPQPGDKPEVVAQKQAARAAAMHGVASEGGSYFAKSNPDASRHMSVFKSNETPLRRDPVRVNTPEEARRLPSGTPIILPDGSPGTVP